MKVKTILISIALIAIVSLVVYRITQNNEKNDTGKNKGNSSNITKVDGIVISQKDFSNNLSLSGSIEANENVEIRSEVSGIVEKIYFTEGTNVSKGQLLLKVNDLELRAQLSQAITKQNLASENERRAKLLLQKEAISQEEYDIASAEFRSLKSQTQLIQAQIAKTAIKAPFSGKIGLRNISPGTYVTPTVLISNLVSTNPLKITFSIPEKHASQVQINAKIKFKVAGSSEDYEAKIYAIEPSIDIATRTLQVRAYTENKNRKLFPGTYANVELPLDVIKNAILIPTEAIIPIQNGKKVYVSKNNKVTEVIIKTDTRTEKNVLVLDGLKNGDTLITSGIMSLKLDAPVKVTVQ